MESVISITLDIRNGDRSGWSHSIKVVIVHSETPCVLSRFQNRLNWTFKMRSRGHSHAFTKAVLCEKFQSLKALCYLTLSCINYFNGAGDGPWNPIFVKPISKSD